MTENDKVDVNLRLNSINELRFSLDLDEVTDSSAEYEIGFGFDFSPNKENKSLTVSTRVALRAHDKVFLECWYSFEFNINEIDEVIEFNDSEIKSKGDILPSLLGISFSTLRGILHTKTLGTKISPLVLPIINPQELISVRTEQAKN